jgi:hypothetical protein
VLAEAGMGECTRSAALLDVEGLRRIRSSAGGFNRLIRNRIEMYRPVYNSTSFYPPNQFADSPMDSNVRIKENFELALQKMEESHIIPPRKNTGVL